MIGFTEAVIYGMYTFGKAYESCTETPDGGYVYWNVKDEDCPQEAQSWEEFEHTWKTALECSPEFKAYAKKKLASRKFRPEYAA